MNFTMEQYQESAQALRARLGGFVPKVAMVLGSGLGYLGDEVEDPIAVDYRDIPHFKASTAPGHKGRLVFGLLEGQRVAVMQGRMHHYEGYSYEEVSYAVRVLRLLGCDTLVVTNAAGCVNLEWKAGDLMLITDQIKMFSESPLRGENLPEFGVRFPDASHLYTPRLRELARETAAELSGLEEDIFAYSGLGCRNVSLLFLPRGYMPELRCTALNEKYRRNYLRERALLRMRRMPFVDLDGAVLCEDRSFPAALSRIHYTFYDSLADVEAWLAAHDDRLQCVVSQCVRHSRRVAFGRAQHPGLTDYADDVDTMRFLGTI